MVKTVRFIGEKMVLFKIYGPVKGKGRPKFAQMGQRTFAYTPKKTVNYEECVRNAFLEVAKDFNFGEQNIYVEFVEYRLIPKSFSKRRREQALRDEIFPGKKPDMDNVEKCIGDALNRVAYHDDAQICGVKKFKVYTKNDMEYIEVKLYIMTKEILIRELGEEYWKEKDERKLN